MVLALLAPGALGSPMNVKQEGYASGKALTAKYDMYPGDTSDFNQAHFTFQLAWDSAYASALHMQQKLTGLSDDTTMAPCLAAMMIMTGSSAVRLRSLMAVSRTLDGLIGTLLDRIQMLPSAFHTRLTAH
ncbi:uncharacterized protein L969DRAFT_94740 [Mixia osmundae IAM 14324]|uniref:Uncharacterized protein n=1 Tax=Mixia osmundae (strain CBS 9802 / IAM 14324 / JCM 22182 / KY 12970) TaxID=764103 RepID=G7E438_MIXOS|nr:uncharacterized protein L969DRAFT_94740 [Mixia osmundae IAM 14324]KEI39693.1 hypothetical protein L969DRAFT_94740 [Mixia osmundae IAM 14324]GAA97598.1 hypothetical protein E5Q_04276 [Mixia osmundae IAM 14324]